MTNDPSADEKKVSLLDPNSSPVRAEGKFLLAGEEKFFVQGVSYGPFRPQSDGSYLPERAVVTADLAAMGVAGINLVRIYHAPPGWFLDACQEAGIRVMVTLPWAQHVDFLSDREIRDEVIASVVSAVGAHVGHPALFGYLVGNEVPGQMVRWLGQRRTRRFLEQLIDRARTVNPGVLYSYATYPTTEYLIPRNADFCTFNVYLHEPDAFARYLARLQNLAGDKPLVIGEFGMDSRGHDEAAQAELLGWHVDAVVRGGAAGTVVFSWTDEWFTGGQDVTEWAFGVVRRDRSRKLAFEVLRTVFAGDGAITQRVPLAVYPKVSVIVCSYNGGNTVRGCLEALESLRYPDYEVVFVDDGSTDETATLLDEFPDVLVVRQENHGLSHARNRGAAAATGEVLAYTDSDCMPDADWLYYLVATLQTGDYAGVGGPNVPPPSDSVVRACVAAAPGGPTHVLLSDVVAEHIPGCNMAFYREAFERVGGFDERYRKAGDDVDFCWRLQQAGEVIAFSPAALVWHHRRFTPAAFLRQQWGYGEAESLLRFKHLAFFSPMGNARWRGTVYGQRAFRWLPTRDLVYHGVFGSGLFQSIYPTGESELASYFRSLEWVVVACVLALVAIPVEGLRLLPVLMLGATGLVAFNFMLGARIEPGHTSLGGRLLVGWLALVQPLVRGWARYLTWLRVKRTPRSVLLINEPCNAHRVRAEGRDLILWSGRSVGREQLLAAMLETFEQEGWSYSVDTGWNAWDVKIYGNMWWSVVMRTVTEYHGGPRCLTRVRFSLQPVLLLVLVALVGVGMVAWLGCGEPLNGVGAGVVLGGVFGWVGWRAHRLKSRLRGVLEFAARQCGMDEFPTSDSK